MERAAGGGRKKGLGFRARWVLPLQLFEQSPGFELLLRFSRVKQQPSQQQSGWAR